LLPIDWAGSGGKTTRAGKNSLISERTGGILNLIHGKNGGLANSNDISKTIDYVTQKGTAGQQNRFKNHMGQTLSSRRR